MARIRYWPALIFLSSALSVMASIVSIALDSLAYPFAAAGRMFADLWRPDANQSINIDHIARTIDMPEVMSRFKSFVSRALTHLNFGAGHFEPDRMPA